MNSEKIIDGWKKKSEPEGNHTTNYREVSVTGTETYTSVPLSSYGTYSLFNIGIGTATNSYKVFYGTAGRRMDE